MKMMGRKTGEKGENLTGAYDWEIRIIRSNRKTIGLQIDESLTVTVRAPLRMTQAQIRRFLEEQSAWIEKHRQKMKQRLEAQENNAVEYLSKEELRQLAEQALAYIPERVAFFAPKVNVTYGRITIRNQRSRWGSCSSKGNLNFNCLLMLTPPEVIDYVIVHELCHRLEMNHSPEFWKQVERILPDYKERRRWLKENGNAVMKRNTAPPM